MVQGGTEERSREHYFEKDDHRGEDRFEGKKDL